MNLAARLTDRSRRIQPAGWLCQAQDGISELMEEAAVDPTANEAARIHAQAVVTADIGTTVLGMTPEAFAKAMLLGNTTWTYLGSEVTPAGRAGDDCLFDIAYRTDEGTTCLRYRFRCIGGEWKVVDLEQLD